MKKNKRLLMNQMAAKAAVVVCALLLFTGTVYAAVHFLSPAQIAHEAGDTKLEAAFRSENAMELNETQSFENYDVTLLGMISGKDLTDEKVEAATGEFRDNRTYVVTAIKRKNGEKVSFDDSFFISPLIDGYSQREVNIATLLGGYTEVISEDETVLYHIADMDNIEPFADHTIHLCVQDGGFFDSANNGEAAYHYDKKTGSYTPDTQYEGVNAMFDLPIDPAKADPAKAKKLLEDESGTEGTYVREETDIDWIWTMKADSKEEAWIKTLTPENIHDLARPVEGTKQTVTPDKDGVFTVRYELEEGSGGEITQTVDNLFPDGKTGMCETFSDYCKDDSTIYVDVYTLNEDGTVTFELYEKK